MRALKLGIAVDVIGAALGSLTGALLAIRHPDRVGRLMMCAVAPDVAGATRAYAELSLALARLEMTPADWGAIKALVLVASGVHDFLMASDGRSQVVALIPNARLEVVAVAGHFPHLQAPATVVRLARDF